MSRDNQGDCLILDIDTLGAIDSHWGDASPIPLELEDYDTGPLGFTVVGSPFEAKVPARRPGLKLVPPARPPRLKTCG
jgi:hypothetical protein